MCRETTQKTLTKLRELQRNDLRWDSTYRKARGSFAQQDEIKGKSVQEIVNMYGAVSNIPGDCNRQRIQTELDNQAATELREKLKIYKKDQERYESFNQLIDIDYFIKETYRGLGYEYNIIPNGTIQQRVDYILNEIR